MNEEELTLELTIEMSDDDLFFVAKDLIESYYGSAISDDGNYIFQNSRNSPLCFVAHIDTMRLYDDVSLQFDGRILRNKNGVLGADDRAGVYLIFRILRECAMYGLPYPSILLTNFEELGCWGVTEFIRSGYFERLQCKENIKVFMGLDCGGDLEYVSYDALNPPELIKYIEEGMGFKHRESYLRSDVCMLTEAYQIPAVNLSVGYFNQHKSNEYLDIQSLSETLNRVLMMIKNPFKEPDNESEMRQNWVTQNVCGLRSGSGTRSNEL